MHRHPQTPAHIFKSSSLFQLLSSHRALYYGSPPFLQGLGPLFPLALAQRKVTNLKDFKDALNVILVLEFWLISHEPHQSCKAKDSI